MSKTHSPKRPPLSTTPPHILALASMGSKLGVILVIAGLVFMAIPGLAWYQTRTILDPWFFWGGFLAFWSLFCGAFYLAYLGSMKMSESVRLLIVSFGGGVGIATILLGLILPFVKFSDVFAGGVPEWRKNPQPVFLCIFILLGGIGLTFASIMAARGSERESITMRRILYGANTVITTLLLLAILGVVNVLSFVNLGKIDFFNTTFDYTQSNLYTLSSGTRELLQGLEEPVHVYMMISEGSIIGQDTRTLLENCKQSAPKGKFTWQSASRDRDQSQLEKLAEKFQIADSQGILVIYGPEGGKQQHDFIAADKLYSLPQRSPNPMEESQGGFSYLGEEVLRKSIILLKEGKTEAKIYFTSGNGELSVSPGPQADSASQLVQQLEKANYKVEALPFDIKLKQIPADAEMVIVARPKTDPPQEAINALREYLTKDVGGKKGKAVFMLDAERSKQGSKAIWTPMPNLKALLSEFQVLVGDNQLLTLRERDQTLAPAVANPRSQNKVPMSFGRGVLQTEFGLQRARTVGPIPQPPNVPPSNKFKVEEVLLVPVSRFTVEESDPNVDPTELTKELFSDTRKLQARLTKPSYTAAVFVSEGGSGIESIPGHETMASDSKPRLAVFGSGSWIANGYSRQEIWENNYNFLYSTLSWLRDRSDVGEKPKGNERKIYRLGLTADSPVFTQIKWLPLWLMMAGVAIIGGSVWVVRRR